MLSLLALTLITLVSIYICYRLAREKNRSTQTWIIIACLVGPLAIPFIVWAKPLDPNDGAGSGGQP